MRKGSGHSVHTSAARSQHRYQYGAGRYLVLQVVRKLNGPTLVQKGSADNICDGRTTLACTREGSPRRAGGQVGCESSLLAPLCAKLQSPKHQVCYELLRCPCCLCLQQQPALKCVMSHPRNGLLQNTCHVTTVSAEFWPQGAVLSGTLAAPKAGRDIWPESRNHWQSTLTGHFGCGVCRRAMCCRARWRRSRPGASTTRGPPRRPLQSWACHRRCWPPTAPAPPCGRWVLTKVGMPSLFAAPVFNQADSCGCPAIAANATVWQLRRPPGALEMVVCQAIMQCMQHSIAAPAMFPSGMSYCPNNCADCMGCPCIGCVHAPCCSIQRYQSRSCHLRRLQRRRSKKSDGRCWQKT